MLQLTTLCTIASIIGAVSCDPRGDNFPGNNSNNGLHDGRPINQQTFQ